MHCLSWVWFYVASWTVHSWVVPVGVVLCCIVDGPQLGGTCGGLRLMATEDPVEAEHLAENKILFKVDANGTCPCQTVMSYGVKALADHVWRKKHQPIKGGNEPPEFWTLVIGDF